MTFYLLLCLVTGVTCRSVVPFQYAWRFHYGDDPSSPPESGPGTGHFDVDLQDVDICDGMEHNPNRFSEKDCRIACMYDPGCYAWQAFPIKYGRACYHGYSNNITCKKPSGSKMGGGRRLKSPVPAFRTDYSFAVADASSTVDKTWAVVDVPHDFVAEYANFTNNIENYKQGYLPRNASWYRKHFRLPSDWKSDGGVTYVHFEGVFHHATIFLNGQYLLQHECGYTGFTVRLDNATQIRFGNVDNVLAVRADASFGSGHWYEGGGIYRPVHLVHAAPTHIVHDGLFVPSQSDGTIVTASAEVETASPHDTLATVNFTLYDLDKSSVLTTSVSTVTVRANGTTMATVTMHPPPKAVKLWSIQTPWLYSVKAEVIVGTAVVDTMEVEVGFRTTSFSGKDGVPPFVLNNDPIKFRGFSHHNSIGALGVAIPERVQLFRVQASRALGANIWRMSHNPYDPALYRLLDTTGTMCWDENRDYGAKYLNGVYAVAMHDMVKRDRNHPSIILWSFCNEFECEQFDANLSGYKYSHAAHGVDTTRPLTANGPAAPAYLDVQGFSHSKNNTFINFHKENPGKPCVLSECCSCTSQREDRTLPACIAEQNSPGLLPYVTGSLGVWTLMDYFGEPPTEWPAVSCDFGQFDLAGFPKPHAYWYTANWAQRHVGQPGSPAIPRRTVTRVLDLVGSSTVSALTTAPFAELFVDGVSKGVEATQKNDLGEVTATTWAVAPTTNPLTAPSSSASADPCTFPILANNVQCHGLRNIVSASSAAACRAHCCAEHPCNTWQYDATKGCWAGVSNELPGHCPAQKAGEDWVGGQRAATSSVRNLTVLALDGSNAAAAKVLGAHTVLMPTANASGYKLQLSLDVPSVATGTGSALVLDGRDTALVRVMLVDARAHGALVTTAAHNITWRVVSGPGRLAGVANGDPTDHTWMKSATVPLHLGLARGTARVNQDCTSSARAATASIDVDSGRGPTTVHAAGTDCDTSDIVVEASAPGLAPVRLSIPVSVDIAQDGVFAVARATATFTNGFSYISEFVG